MLPKWLRFGLDLRQTMRGGCEQQFAWRMQWPIYMVSTRLLRIVISNLETFYWATKVLQKWPTLDLRGHCLGRSRNPLRRLGERWPISRQVSHFRRLGRVRGSVADFEADVVPVCVFDRIVAAWQLYSASRRVRFRDDFVGVVFRIPATTILWVATLVCHATSR